MTRFPARALALAGVLIALPWVGIANVPRAHGQFFNNRAVGGVAISADGVLEAPTDEDQRDLDKLRQNVRLDVPATFGEFTELRTVSLKRIEAALAHARAANTPIPDHVRYLAGLQRAQYVFVYPERSDLVLAGPAEGWTINGLGHVVGRTTNLPVLLLDDLLVALRSGARSRYESITCSIDPTPDGLRRVQELTVRLATARTLSQPVEMIEEALGPQRVSVTGVPPTSHFARAMVAADFRMKRLAMGFDPAPIAGLPSFLSMISPRQQNAGNMMPRWWLAAQYEPLAKTADGLAWELRGPGVKCMTEAEYLSETGEKRSTGAANPLAEKWAQNMTDKFGELAQRDSSFGQLRNLMDLAVIGALVEKEQLVAASGLKAPWILNRQPHDEYPAPTQTASKASMVRKRGGWVIGVSGGVEITPWQIAAQTETLEAVGAVRARAAHEFSEPHGGEH